MVRIKCLVRNFFGLTTFLVDNNFWSETNYPFKRKCGNLPLPKNLACFSFSQNKIEVIFHFQNIKVIFHFQKTMRSSSIFNKMGSYSIFHLVGFKQCYKLKNSSICLGLVKWTIFIDFNVVSMSYSCRLT